MNNFHLDILRLILSLLIVISFFVIIIYLVLTGLDKGYSLLNLNLTCGSIIAFEYFFKKFLKN